MGVVVFFLFCFHNESNNEVFDSESTYSTSGFRVCRLPVSPTTTTCLTKLDSCSPVLLDPIRDEVMRCCGQYNETRQRWRGLTINVRRGLKVPGNVNLPLLCLMADNLLLKKGGDASKKQSAHQTATIPFPQTGSLLREGGQKDRGTGAQGQGGGGSHWCQSPPWRALPRPPFLRGLKRPLPARRGHSFP